MKKKHLFKGQSLVEFALVFPIFFFLVTGMIDLGRAVFAYSTMNTAARELTRYVIVLPKADLNNDITAFNSKLKPQLNPIRRIMEICLNDCFNPSNPTVPNDKGLLYGISDFINNYTLTITRVGTTTNPKINIHISYVFRPITPGLSQVLGKGKTIPIAAESEMFIAPVGK